MEIADAKLKLIDEKIIKQSNVKEIRHLKEKGGFMPRFCHWRM
jgi:hypothetical protein